MRIDTKSIVSMTEANQNFAKVMELVDELGTAIIMKNNVPRYVVFDFQQVEEEEVAIEESIQVISQKLMEKNKEAYEVLSK